jgi:hypothetical protein
MIISLVLFIATPSVLIAKMQEIKFLDAMAEAA